MVRITTVLSCRVVPARGAELGTLCPRHAIRALEASEHANAIRRAAWLFPWRGRVDGITGRHVTTRNCLGGILTLLVACSEPGTTIIEGGGCNSGTRFCECDELDRCIAGLTCDRGYCIAPGDEVPSGETTAGNPSDGDASTGPGDSSNAVTNGEAGEETSEGDSTGGGNGDTGTPTGCTDELHALTVSCVSIELDGAMLGYCTGECTSPTDPCAYYTCLGACWDEYYAVQAGAYESCTEKYPGCLEFSGFVYAECVASGPCSTYSCYGEAACDDDGLTPEETQACANESGACTEACLEQAYG